ncbi:NDR1/HIN1-like protein 12 [Canna indica]|uniref:NDR1/HIN1-like protein 12 n=1 Tax=Canna indica TaxID=4628 RepID=A0AAQ3KPG9_9LILI|nr:NDR1/HIN1-like protein 12 [Canna indica]
MGEKQCYHHRHHHHHLFFHSCRCRTLRIIASVAAAFVLVVLLTVFTIWLVLRPTKPTVYLKDAVVHQFNLSLSDNILSAVIQPTLSSHNPNGRIGVFYDHADAFAVYQNQQITSPTPVPPFYQGHDDVNLWSPFLAGAAVPVAPDLCSALLRDEEAGFLVLYIKINGRIRWKVGKWTSGRYHLEVSCPALFSFSNTMGGGVAVVQFQRMSPCSVSV